MGYQKQLWGVFHYLVLSVLQEVTVGHIVYGRLHVTEYVLRDIYAQSRDLLSCKAQVPGGVKQVACGKQCLMGGLWYVAGGG
jgi:hypothetical protein